MVNSRECEAAGISPQTVEGIRRHLERVCREAAEHGILVFMGSGCSLRASDGNPKLLILAPLNIPNGDGDGGDGAEIPDDEGLMRGE